MIKQQDIWACFDDGSLPWASCSFLPVCQMKKGAGELDGEVS